MVDYDYAVIGAGAAGLSVASALSAEASVVVLEREEQPAYHSSGRSAAVFAEFLESAVVAQLTQAARPFFFAPPPGFCEQPLVRPLGGLTVAGAEQGIDFERYVRLWKPLNPNLQTITAEQALELIPALDPQWLAQACYDPTLHSIDVHELLGGYRRQLKTRGGVLLVAEEVTALEWAAAAWTLQTAHQQLRVQTVVNCTGAWADDLARLAGLPAVGLTPMRRTALLCPAPAAAADWPMLHDCANTLYFKPEGGALMLSPADEHPSAPCDAQPEEIDVAIAIDRFQQMMTLPVARVTHRWAGLRTFSADRAPVVGFDPHARGFYWLAGQGGFGVQTAPALARYAADELLGRASMPADLQAALSRQRFR